MATRPHKEDFNGAEDSAYMVDGKAAGRLRTSNGFHFMQVSGARRCLSLPVVAGLYCLSGKSTF